MTLTRGGPDVAVTGGKPLDADLGSTSPALAEAHGLARLTWDGETVALRDRPDAAIRAPLRSRHPPGAFLQATRRRRGGHAGRGARGRRARPQRIVDLFSGVGTFALPLAETTEVHAVEGDAAMTGGAGQGPAAGAGPAPRQPPRRATCSAARWNPTSCKRFDGVVIDPPRAGAEAQAATLARARDPGDRRRFLQPRHLRPRRADPDRRRAMRIDWVQVIDQFRWSTHVELVAALQPPRR